MPDGVTVVGDPPESGAFRPDVNHTSPTSNTAATTPPATIDSNALHMMPPP